MSRVYSTDNVSEKIRGVIKAPSEKERFHFGVD